MVVLSHIIDSQRNKNVYSFCKFLTEKPFQEAVVKCTSAIELIYEAEYLLVKYGIIMRDDTTLLKFERMIFDLSLDTCGIHYHICCSGKTYPVNKIYHELYTSIIILVSI